MQKQPPAVELLKTGLLEVEAVHIIEGITLYLVFSYGKSVRTLLDYYWKRGY